MSSVSSSTNSGSLFEVEGTHLRFGPAKMDLGNNFDSFEAFVSEGLIKLTSDRTGAGDGFSTEITLLCGSGYNTKRLAKTIFPLLPQAKMEMTGIQTGTQYLKEGPVPSFSFENYEDEIGVLEECFPSEDFTIRYCEHTGKKSKKYTIVWANASSEETLKKCKSAFEKLNLRFTNNQIAYALGDNEDPQFPGMKRPLQKEEKGLKCSIFFQQEGKRRQFEITSDQIRRIVKQERQTIQTGPLKTDQYEEPPRFIGIESNQEELDHWLKGIFPQKNETKRSLC